MKRPDGVTLIAVGHLLNGALLALAALLMMILPLPLYASWITSNEGGWSWPLLGSVLGVLGLGGASLLGFVAGWALLKLQEWARWLTIGLALLSLPLFPIGSVAGALIIAYLLQPPINEAFRGGSTVIPPLTARP